MIWKNLKGVYVCVCVEGGGVIEKALSDLVKSPLIREKYKVKVNTLVSSL